MKPRSRNLARSFVSSCSSKPQQHQLLSCFVVGVVLEARCAFQSLCCSWSTCAAEQACLLEVVAGTVVVVVVDGVFVVVAAVVVVQQPVLSSEGQRMY